MSSREEALAFSKTIRTLMEAMGWGFEVIGDFEGFCLRPPAERPVRCLRCGSDVLEIVVYIDAGHGHAQPCNCPMNPMDLLNQASMP